MSKKAKGDDLQALTLRRNLAERVEKMTILANGIDDAIKLLKVAQWKGSASKHLPADLVEKYQFTPDELNRFHSVPASLGSVQWFIHDELSALKNELEKAGGPPPESSSDDSVNCSICAAPTKLCCSACMEKHYCSQNCQIQDWGGHSKVCK